MRLLIARPSDSRTIGAPTISTGIARSRTICRSTASCWKSFSPKAATWQRESPKSRATTVVTPSEVPRTVAAAQALSDLPHLHRGLEVGRVHLGGREHGIHTLGLADRAIRRRVPRVGVEVFVGSELQRVHEQADREHVARGPKPPHQRGMTGVEVAHGRHQPDPTPGGAVAIGPGREGLGRIDPVHVDLA